MSSIITTVHERRNRIASAAALAVPDVPTPPPPGCLDVLNVGAGHLTFRFDKADPEQTAKAKRVIADMLKRGYMLFALVDGEQKRIRKFDPDREEYILEEPDVTPETTLAADDAPGPVNSGAPARRGRPPGRRVPMSTTKATGIGPSAGG